MYEQYDVVTGCIGDGPPSPYSTVNICFKLPGWYSHGEGTIILSTVIIRYKKIETHKIIRRNKILRYLRMYLNKNINLNECFRLISMKIN